MAEDDTDISRVLNGGKNNGSEDDLLPGLADLEHIDTVSMTLVYEQSHTLVGIRVLGVDMRVGGEEDRGVLLAGVQWG